ncbi:hypothetical protein K435DRAFT_787319, partial [Dendrothele bispora CBS 962.96]
MKSKSRLPIGVAMTPVLVVSCVMDRFFVAQDVAMRSIVLNNAKEKIGNVDIV